MIKRITSDVGALVCNTILCLFGLLAAGYFFYESWTLPAAYKGLKCCDVGWYISTSLAGLKYNFFSSTGRGFGYPFFLAAVGTFTSNQDEMLLVAGLLQLLFYVISCCILFICLRQAGLRIPIVALAVVFAQPNIASHSALAISDILATSLISVFIGITAIIFQTGKRFYSKSVVLGLVAGIAITIRNSLIIQLLIFFALIVIALIFARDKESDTFRKSVKRAGIFAALFLIGFLPLYVHMCNNTYALHGEFLLSSRAYAQGNAGRSFHWATLHSRVRGIVNEAGIFSYWSYTNDSSLDQRECNIVYDKPFPSLAHCFLSNIPRLPKHFARRVIGLFDSPWLNSYAILVTSPQQYQIRRAFSAVAFAGFLIVGWMTGTAVVARVLSRHVYLLFPIIFVGVQSVFHPESRYIYPIVPFVSLIALSFVSGRLPGSKLSRLACLVTVTMATVYFYILNTRWDIVDSPNCVASSTCQQSSMPSTSQTR
jgi:hypothetical protein